MSRPDLLQVTLPYGTFGVEFIDGYAVKVAPIGKWMIGKSKLFIAGWVKRHNGSLKHVYPEITKR